MRIDVRTEISLADQQAVDRLLSASREAGEALPVHPFGWHESFTNRQDVAIALFAYGKRDELVGYAELTHGPRGWTVELITAPKTFEKVGPALLKRAQELAAEDGGGNLRLWLSNPATEHDALAAHLGFNRERDLFQMRRSLPVDLPWSIETRPFVSGKDEAAWLGVNNSAFRGHPEQGDWDTVALHARQSEPWFDPDGLLLHERGGRLAGFVWTKVHPDETPPLGEIYILAIDPSFRGMGLGRKLTLSGLNHLWHKGIERAMLYVDTNNVPAFRIYERLGFQVHHVDREYVTYVEDSGLK